MLKRNVGRSVRTALYALQRAQGVPVQIQNVSGGTFDPETGLNTAAKTVVNVRRVVTFSTKQTTRFEYDLGFVAANKNFTYGALFGVGDRVFVVSARDLPKGFEITLQNTHLVFNDKKWKVADFEELDHGAGYIISTRQTQASSPEAVVDDTTEQIITFTQTIAGVL
jgi:hypothetical protein